MDYKIGYHYHIEHKIGHGDLGDVYIGTDEKRQKKIAIKIESLDKNNPLIGHETIVSQHLKNGIGFPHFYYYGKEGAYHVLVMELLGPSLEALLHYCNGHFSIKTVCMLAQEMLLRIQFLHEHNYLHRDLKPEHFVIGIENMRNIVYLIDYSLCKEYQDPLSHQHIPYREKKCLMATPRYASISNHLGREQDRHDDLESLGYILIYFLKGKLLWQGLKAETRKESTRLIFEKKLGVSLKELCNDLPSGFYEYLNYVRLLGFGEEPDYEYLRDIFKRIMIEEGYENDGVYDWMNSSQSFQSQFLPRYCINEKGKLIHQLNIPADPSYSQHMVFDKKDSFSDESDGSLLTHSKASTIDEFYKEIVDTTCQTSQQMNLYESEESDNDLSE